MPAICSGVGISRNANAANAIVNSAWLCTITLVKPTGTPWAMAIGLRQKLPEKQRAADRDQQRPGHIGLAHEQAWHRSHAKRSAVISAGENSSSAIRLATKPRPQITATSMARLTSVGFIG